MKEIFIHIEDMPKDCLGCSLRSLADYPKVLCYAAESLIDADIDKRSDLCPLKCIEDEQPKYGKIKEGFFLRQYIGEGETESGIKFELATSASSCIPIVLIDNEKNTAKKAFILSWDDIVNLANAAGLFNR